MTNPSMPGPGPHNVAAAGGTANPGQTGASVSQFHPVNSNSALHDQVATLAAECKRLSDQHEELKSKLEDKKKDRWDKLGLSGPLFIGAIGLLLTSVLQCDSARRADVARQANERAQDLQSFNIFLPYLISSDSISTDSAGQARSARDSVRQELAIRALRRLGSCNVAALAAGLYPTPGTRAGLLELKRPTSISERGDCGFADTVYERVFLTPPAMRRVGPNDSMRADLGPVDTVRPTTLGADTAPSLLDSRRRIVRPPL
jgi:hypothetical protein